MNLTSDQRDKILTRSRQSQAFMMSDLYKELEKWAATEQTLAAQAIVMDKRDKTEEKLTRSEFVERKSAYYISVVTMFAVIKGFALQEAELIKIEEHDKSPRSEDTH